MGVVRQLVKRYIYSVNKYLSLQVLMMSNKLSEILFCLLQKIRDFVKLFLKFCKFKFILQVLNECLVFSRKMYGFDVKVLF